MPSRRQSVPTVHVDRNEDRLDEEGEAFEREAEPEDVTERGHEAGPQETELEAEDGAGDHAHREERDHDLRPAPGARPEERIARRQVAPLREQHHRGEGDPEADQRDVHRERECLHLPGEKEVLLLGRRESAHHAAGRRRSSDAISLLKSKSVAAGPVISRAPRLNVRSSMAHSTNTVMRLRNWTVPCCMATWATPGNGLPSGPEARARSPTM